MNRADRRRNKISNKPKTYTFTEDQLTALKQDLTNQIVDTAFILMLSIPLRIIHDKFSDIMRREVDGKNRESRFAEMCIDEYDSYCRGLVTLDDLRTLLKEEAGVVVDREHLKGRRII